MNDDDLVGDRNLKAIHSQGAATAARMQEETI
jgi:hypothetical protein